MSATLLRLTAHRTFASQAHIIQIAKSIIRGCWKSSSLLTAVLLRFLPLLSIGGEKAAIESAVR